MSLEVALFFLRLLAGLSLLGFLLTLFVVIWRNLNQTQQGSALAHSKHGYLVSEQPENADAERWALRPIITLGRSNGNSIIVNDDFASAEHARIILEHGKWWLEDRQSRNGTRLNDDTIKQRTVIADGDVIVIGNHRFRIHFKV